jgi:hypothetical protein
MPMFVVLVMVMVMMLARGLGLAGAAGKLVHQLDELIRRGVVLAGKISSFDRDNSIG